MCQADPRLPEMKGVTALRLDMKNSTDVGGRITIYRVELL